jgi:cell division protein FtsB
MYDAKVVIFFDFSDVCKDFNILLRTFAPKIYCMKRKENIFTWTKRHLNKYWIAIIVAFVLTFLVGESSLIKRFSYDRQIRQLNEDIEHYTRQKADNMEKLKALNEDEESLERLAREQYLMTKPDEELFIIPE